MPRFDVIPWEFLPSKPKPHKAVVCSCEYCLGEYQEFLTNCRNCGAPIKHSKKEKPEPVVVTRHDVDLYLKYKPGISELQARKEIALMKKGVYE